MDQSSVYLGLWTNWSHGAVMGATLTLTRQEGDLLIAFTAFLIPYVASRFWSIFCLILHRCYSTSKSRDAIHHQRQVILRNSSSPESGLSSLFWLLWAWRNPRKSEEAKRRFHRLLPLAILATFCIAGFTLAGGFSSRISSAPGNVVLLKGNHCGILANVNDTQSSDYFSTTSEKQINAANYAQQCHSANNSSGLLECNKFVVNSLPVASMQTNSSCPFQDSLCMGENTSLLLDTGYIDSNDHLGINTEEGHRFRWRYILQCSPLVTESYTSESSEANVTWVNYHYGGQPGAPKGWDGANTTWESEGLEEQYKILDAGQGVLTGLNYRLSAMYSTTIGGQTAGEVSGFVPIPELFRPDGDLSIMFLSGNGVMFSEEMDDEWYRATVLGRNITANNGSTWITEYKMSEAASPLGCIEQWQWCNGTACGPLASLVDSINGAAPMFDLTADDLVPARPVSATEKGSLFIWPMLIQTEGAFNIPNIVTSLGNKLLASQTLLYYSIQYPLPLHQWQTDVANMLNTVLASVQAGFVYSAVGSTDPGLEDFQYTPLTDQERKLCSGQKVRSTAYASFSVFGLLFTYLASLIIIVISYLLEPILGLLQRHRRYKEYTHLEWTTNGVLQLHRLAQEEIDCGTWSKSTDSVPTTTVGEMMASLDISDLEHPVLMRNTTKFEADDKSVKTSGDKSSGTVTVVETTDTLSPAPSYSPTGASKFFPASGQAQEYAGSSQPHDAHTSENICSHETCMNSPTSRQFGALDTVPETAGTGGARVGSTPQP